MSKGLFCVLLLFIGGALLAQNKATKNLTISVTSASPTGNLLTGMTPGNYKLPSGWNLLCTQDFDNSNYKSACENGPGTVRVAYGQQCSSSSDNFGYTVTPHSGKYMLCGSNTTGAPNFKLLYNGPCSSSSNCYSGEVYISFWQYNPPTTVNGILPLPFSGGNSAEANFMTNSQISSRAAGGGVDNGCCMILRNTTSPTSSYTITFDYGPNVYMSGQSTSLLYDGQWHQWEIHFKPNTISSSGTANADGTIQWWRDGVLVGSQVNKAIQGATDLRGQSAGIGGNYINIVWMNSINGSGPTTASCKNLFNYGTGSNATANNQTWSCGSYSETSGWTGYGCPAINSNGASLSWKQMNSFCSKSAPSGQWRRYGDDMIILYR